MKLEAEGLSLRGHTVLVVEDDVTLRTLLVDILIELGAHACGFGNAEDALIHLLENHGNCSLIIADHGVPGTLKGVEFLQMVGEKWPDIPTILTSGFQLESLGEDLSSEFLFKPWSVEELTATIAKALVRKPGITQQDVDQHPA
ncbi:response regulator [Pseudomonas putida]|uniref:response regulator n=1 Tax=Pseudomonas putida TaxID=303 RepID=UPI001E451276|nr:response regulator [Pseudomonas putida]EKT4451407.1 response regulator [Pseudomonas putida]MCC9009735.1 response regulator [Pseudomonas putida]